MSDTFDEAEARALLERVRAADGRAPDGPPGPDAAAIHARHDADGVLIALAWRQHAGEAGELYVDPAHRGRGIGRELAGALLADDGPAGEGPADAGGAGDRGGMNDVGAGGAQSAAGGIATDGRENAGGAHDDVPGPGTRPGIWAHGTLPAARHLAARLGLAPQRELLQLRASLAPFRPAPPPDGALNQTGVIDDELPAGVVIRTFVPGADDAEFLRVNAAAFAWHPEQGRLSQADLDAEAAEPWFDADGFFLAVTADDPARVLGFHWTKVHPARPPAEPEVLGEIYVLGVDPASPIRHLGGPLTAAGLRYLAARGLGTALLYVEADNERAVKLYRRYGFADYAVDTVFG